MLRFFRGEGVGQAVVGSIVVAIIIVFVIQFRTGAGPTAGLKLECAVETANNCVDEKDYMASYGLAAARGLTPKQVRQLDLRRRILEGLVERELLISEADKLGVSISDQEVDAELAKGRFRVSVPASASDLNGSLRLLDGIRLVSVSKGANESVETGEFDYQVYERQVRNYTNRSPKEFKEMQRRELIATRMRDLIRTRVQVPEAEVFSEFERERSKVVARIVELKRAWFSKYTTTLKDAQVEEWATAHKAEVDGAWTSAQPNWVAECPLVSEILVKIPANTSDEDKLLLRERLNQAEARLKKPEPFEQVAREVSEAPNADVGGYVGCLTDKYGPGAETMLKALTHLKVGATTAILESPVGFHLLQFHGKLPKDDVEKVGRFHVARALALRFAADETINRFATELLTRAAAGKTLEVASAELVEEFAPLPTAANAGGKKRDYKESPAWLDADRPKVEVTPPFPVTRSPIFTAPASEAVASKLFALKNPDELLPKPVSTSEGMAVAQLKEKQLAKREDFDKEKSRYVGAVRTAKASESLVAYVAQLRKSAGDRLKLNTRFAEPPKAQDDSG